jgi:TIR domain-containing protein
MLFLSYSPNDIDHLLPLAERLRAEGLNLWFDSYKVEPGDSFVRKISEGLAESDRLVVAWSQNSAASEHVQNELDAFYMLRPHPSSILFMRLDETPIPTLYAARRYFHLAGDIERAVQVILMWSSGQGDGKIHDAEETLPPPEVLHRFPRGPRVPFHLVTDDLVSAFAELLDTRTHANRILNKANQIRREADPDDSTVTILNSGFLPTFGTVGPYAYWQDVFHAACLNGPRMLGSLLLAQPDDLFTAKARSDRAKLFQHLHAMSQS